MRVFAGPDGVAHVDWHGKWKGRGAWITCERKMFEQAMSKPALLVRALHEERLDVAGLLDEARAANQLAIRNLLALSARAGAVVSGADALERTAPESLVGLIFADDASTASAEAAAARFPELLAVRIGMNREELGHQIGKGPRAVLGFRRAAPTRALLAELRRSLALG